MNMVSCRVNDAEAGDAKIPLGHADKRLQGFRVCFKGAEEFKTVPL